MDVGVACFVWIIGIMPMVWMHGMDTTSWMEHKTVAVGYWRGKSEAYPYQCDRWPEQTDRSVYGLSKSLDRKSRVSVKKDKAMLTRQLWTSWHYLFIQRPHTGHSLMK